MAARLNQPGITPLSERISIFEQKKQTSTATVSTPTPGTPGVNAIKLSLWLALGQDILGFLFIFYSLPVPEVPEPLTLG
jgi:hypothetical protein